MEVKDGPSEDQLHDPPRTEVGYLRGPELSGRMQSERL